MAGDLYLGKLFGIPFRLHWSWLLAVFLIAWTLAVGFFPQTLPQFAGERGVYWGLGVLAALGLFVSVLLHELGHALLALRFDVPVRGIRLFIFGGVAELGSEPKKPGHEILIALAGPAVTLVLIVLFNIALSVTIAGGGAGWDMTDGVLHLRGAALPVAGSAAVLFYLGVINTVVLLFNLIPAFPLDGGRVLRGVLWAITGNYLQSTRIAGGIGIGFAWLLFIGGFWLAFQGNLLGGVWMFFIGTFLQNAAHSGIAYAQLQHLLRGRRVADVMRRQPVTVDAHQTLQEVVDQFFLRYPHKAYPVVDHGRLSGILTLGQLQQIDRHQWEVLRVGDAVAGQGPLPVLRPSEPLVGALRKLAESGQSRLPVAENGDLVGLLCQRDVMNFMEIRAGLALPRPQTEWSSPHEENMPPTPSHTRT